MTNVLIIEDSATQAESIRLVVEAEGYHAEIAKDGESGVERLRQGGIDVAVCDVVMPGMSGFDLCRFVRGDPCIKKTPILMLTALDDPIHIMQALEAGADNYVTKPFEPDYLASRLKHLLVQRSLGDGARFDLAVEVEILGKQFNINSDRRQILGMLVSTFEDIFHANIRLKQQQDNLASAHATIKEYAKQLEGDVKASEEKYRAITQNANDAILVLDPDGTITDANRRAGELTAVPSGSLIGRNVNEFLHPPPGTPASHALLDQDGGHDATGLQFTIAGDQGERREVEVSASRTAIAGQDVRILIVRDVTLRNQAERMFRAVVAYAPYAIVITRTNGEVLLANTKAESYFGFGPGEMVGRTVTTLFSGPFPDASDSPVGEALRERCGTVSNNGNGDVALLRRDGSEFRGEVSIGSIDSPDGELVVVSISDVTQRRTLERQLHVAQRMESVGQLAGGIAHDFNNILAVITSYAGFLVDQFPADHPALADAQTVLDAAERASNLTRQLLAFSRRQTMQFTNVDLNGLVQGLEKMLRRIIGEDIELFTVLAEELPTIHCDASQIEQVVMNLAVNARDAMAAGGELTIESHFRMVTEEYASARLDVTPGPYVVLAVTDTGSGMDEETQSRVFEPFFTTKELGKGTGLGLATVFGIVKQMQGSIYVYSEVGKGTTFKIFFPANPGGDADAVVSPVESQDLSGSETILLVEDEELVRRAAVRILEEGGYQVLAAENTEVALQLFDAHEERIELLLTDVVMPGGSGPSLYERVKERRAVRVIFMSGYTDDAIVNHGILEGMYPFLNKPFGKQSLLTKVREVLGSEPLTA